MKRLKAPAVFDEEPVESVFVINDNINREISSSLFNTFFDPDPIKRSSHKFWQKDSDLKAVYTESFLREKLDYIHANPIQEHWSIVEKPESYSLSSCRYYFTGDDWNRINILSLLERIILKNNR